MRPEFVHLCGCIAASILIIAGWSQTNKHGLFAGIFLLVTTVGGMVLFTWCALLLGADWGLW